MANVQCPECKRVHGTPDVLIGKEVRCKDCLTTFVAAESDLAPSELAAEESAPSASRPELKVFDPSRLAAPAVPKRAGGIVWIVFYWVLCGFIAAETGASFVMAGGTGGGIASSASAFREFRGIPGLPPLPPITVEAMGVGLFHLGLLTLVTCYGLWTFRAWGLYLARRLAIGHAVLALTLFIFCIVNGEALITGMAGLLFSIGVICYFFRGVAKTSPKASPRISPARKPARSFYSSQDMWRGYD